MRTRIPVFVATLMLMAPALRAEVLLHPSWNTRAKSDWVLVVFPATYDIVTQTAGGGRSLRREESDVIQAQLGGYVASALQAKGWTIADDVFRRQDLVDNRELLYLVGYLRERHATLAQRIMVSSKEMKAGRVSFGKPITELRPYTRANILVFVHVEGLDYTRAARILRIAGTAASVALTGGATGYLAAGLFDPEAFKGRQVRIRVSFVDANTGDVLCFVRQNDGGEASFLKELDKLRQ
jgi:hypothetical protein